MAGGRQHGKCTDHKIVGSLEEFRIEQTLRSSTVHVDFLLTL